MIKNAFLCGLVLMIGIIMTGCNAGSTESSYGGYLMIDGKQYTWQGDVENEEFTVAEKIGEVSKKVDVKTMPKTNFASNILEVGEEIYTSNEDSRVIIVKRDYNGEYEKFTEGDYYKEENSE